MPELSKLRNLSTAQQLQINSMMDDRVTLERYLRGLLDRIAVALRNPPESETVKVRHFCQIIVWFTILKCFLVANGSLELTASVNWLHAIHYELYLAL